MRTPLFLFLTLAIAAALLLPGAPAGAAPISAPKPPRPTATPTRTRTSTPTSTVTPVRTATATSTSTATPTSPSTGNIPITVNVDTSQERATISPYIYGSNTDLGLSTLTLRRLGGNRMTGYNWETNASNAGSDWNHQSDNFMCGAVGLTSTQCASAGGVIAGWQNQSVAMSAASMLTLQMAGYVAADMNGPVATTETAPSSRWKAAPPPKGSAFTTSPDPNDGNVYMDEQVNFMVNRYGPASAANGVKMYLLDNEPDLWSSTHPRIHPNAVGAAELVTHSAGLAKAVKAVDPSSQVFGFESYGFNGYYSLQDAPDWGSVKGSYGWYIDYYLDRMKQEGNVAGKRLLDGLSVHWYPEAQGGGQRIVFGGAGSVDTQKARVQAPRTLWDPGYHEDSWIAQWFASYLPIIPRLQQSINAYYPGTKLAITEYTYGGESDVSGGLAQADVLGIFGKYGVYAGAFWPVESDQSYIRAAVQLYRNYDGVGSKYGDTKVRAATSNAADSSAYASIVGSDDSTLHIVVLNKNFDSPADFTFNLAGGRTFQNGEVWAFDAGSAAVTQRGPIASIANNRFAYTLQPRTAAHIVLHASGGPVNTPASTNTPTTAPVPTNTPTSSPISTNTPTSVPVSTNTPTSLPVPTSTPTAKPSPTNTPNASSADLVVYGDALATGWQDWSWNTTANYGNSSPVQSGSNSIAVTYNAGWAGLSPRAPSPVSTANYSGISFWVYGSAGSGPVGFYIQTTDGGTASPAFAFTPVTGQWTQYTLSWSQLGSPAQVARLNWQEYSGAAKPAIYIDNVRFVAR